MQTRLHQLGQLMQAAGSGNPRRDGDGRESVTHDWINGHAVAG